MASSADFILDICDCIPSPYQVRYRKMFGEYMIYVNEKPILLVCDNIVYVKKLPELNDLLKDNEVGIPYASAKEHYILNINERSLMNDVIDILEKVTPLPKKKKSA